MNTKQFKKEKKMIDKLFSDMNMLKHYWFINAICFGKISLTAPKEEKKKRFKRFLERRKAKGLPTDRVK